MLSRRNSDEPGSHTRRPHVMTGLYFLERLVVVDMLLPIVEIDNDLGVAIGQKTIDRMSRLIALVIDETIDKMIERKPRNVSLKNHCESLVQMRQSLWVPASLRQPVGRGFFASR